MNSKEALEILFSSYNFDGNYHDLIIARKKLEQSLDRLEKLEKENKGLEELVWKKVKELVNEEYRSKELYDKNIELKQEIAKLKKALNILKSAFIIEFKGSQSDYFEKFYTIKLIEYNTIKCESVIGIFEECEKEDYELLKEVLCND